ncbi:MAG: hypothetical protein SAJ37_17170 [Oscillatoria sp. PMC 1068.18]|nr:hypothetical protein [Oscillatoria sp. PMC 1076.18]MEC4990464.1 hypothetical protein [Oscillatoria sp. PMC 1068.18]
MGFFGWLGSLVDELVAWLGRVFLAFIEALANVLQAIWYTSIASVLIAAFGAVATLYVIFYAGFLLGETIMEIWDPRYLYKESQVFELRQAPANSPLPNNRSKAKVLELRQ